MTSGLFKRSPLAVAGIFLLLSPNISLGQENASANTPSGDPQLKLSPSKVLQNFEPPVGEEYTIGPGDQITLDFPGRPELAVSKVVGPDGRITLPLVGPIIVSDLTRSQIATLVVGDLSKYYKDLTVTVSVDKYGSNRIVVLGNVSKPGVLYFDDTPTLLDVLARGGLMSTTTGEPGRGSSAMDSIPERCAIYRGNDQVLWVDLRALLQSGSASADLRLRRNDIVFVPAQQQIFVSVLGSVTHPGAVPLTPESTLASILAESGGLAEGASNNIQIVQPSSGKTITVSFKSLLTVAGNNEIKLHPGDVIFVPKTGFYKFTYATQRISSVASMGILTALIP
jgi:polysaccharide export outer membrane protein